MLFLRSLRPFILPSSTWLTIFCLCFLCKSTSSERKLRFVQAIWRHGDRAPSKKPYPNDLNDEWLVSAAVKQETDEKLLLLLGYGPEAGIS